MLGWSYRPILIAAMTVAPAVAPDEPTATAGIDARYYQVVRETLDAFKDELLAADPGLDPAALRSKLHVQALDLINQTLDAPVPEDRLLTLPAPLKADADRLAAELTGGPAAASDLPEALPDPKTKTDADGRTEVPARLRGFEDVLADCVASLADRLREGGSDPSSQVETLEQAALEVAAEAITTTGKPEDLTPDEADYARAVARQIASGDGPPPVDEAIESDLDALGELLRREDARLRLSEGLRSPDDRAARLADYGDSQIEASLKARDPSATLGDEVKQRIATLADLTARGVVVRPVDDPGAVEPPPSNPSGPPSGIDPALWRSVESLARAVDRGLIAAGLDPAVRRSTLERFVLERIGGQAGVDSLTAAVRQEASRLVDAILRGGGQPWTVGVPTTPVVTVPAPTAPTVYILVPARHRWCPWPAR